MKYTEKDILKIEKWLAAIADHTEAREKRFGKDFINGTVPQLKQALMPLRSIANAVSKL